MNRQLAGSVAAVAAVVVTAATVVLALSDRLPVAVALLGLVGGFLLLAALVGLHRLRDLQRSAAAWEVELRALSRQAAEARTDQVAVREEQARLAAGLQRLADTQREQSEAQQRLLTSTQQDQQEVVDRQQALQHAVDELRKTTGAMPRRLENHLVKRQREQARELEAMAQLFPLVAPRAPMPPSGGWALDPSELLELWFTIATRRPKLVLELGSGTSSVWIGYAIAPYQGRLISIDHHPDFAEQTRRQLLRHGLADTVEVRHAPLRPLPLAEETFEWYDVAAFTDLTEVDLLLVDGPPGTTGPRARQPALPVLQEHLAPQATVILDDSTRPDEQEILQAWLDSVPGLVVDQATIGRAAVLSYTRVGAPEPE